MLTKENYFSRENNIKYMGSSQFKSFMKCEKEALAEVLGFWSQEKTKALLIGSYVDAHFSKGLDLFKAQTPEIFKKNGELKSDFLKANEIIARLERDEYMMKFMDGQPQQIMTGEIAGVPFKIMVDSMHLEKCLVDLKVIKDFQPVWSDKLGHKISFVEFWGYDTQGAIYQAIEGSHLPFLIAGITKEKESDLAMISIPQERLDEQLLIVEGNVKRFDDIKKGLIEPVGCGVCDYCRSIKKVGGIVSYEDL